MIVYPAVDLIGGEAVRLFHGDYKTKKVYYHDPLEAASAFYAQGGRYLHVVDLEGARDGGTPNFDTVKRLIDRSGLKVEIGGGVRDEDTVKKYLDAGAYRVILGTAAVRDPAFLARAVSGYGARVAVGADVRDMKIAVRGWLEDSGVDLLDFCAKLVRLGGCALICTDISRDGALSGTNLDLYRRLCDKRSGVGLPVVASGGVNSAAEISSLRETGAAGVIIGKALYEHRIDLADAVKAAGEQL